MEQVVPIAKSLEKAAADAGSVRGEFEQKNTPSIYV
jgi:hypothetical protein